LGTRVWKRPRIWKDLGTKVWKEPRIWKGIGLKGPWGLGRIGLGLEMATGR